MCILASPLQSTRPSAWNVTILNFHVNSFTKICLHIQCWSSRRTNIHTPQHDLEAAEHIWDVTGWLHIYGDDKRSIRLQKRVVTVLEKLALLQLVKLPAFYGTLGFITVCTTACHWPTSSAKLIQSTPSNPISLATILILSSYLHLCFQWSYCFMFPNQNPAGISIFQHACHMHYLCHHISVKVRLDQREIISVKTVTGRREGCCLSRNLISLYSKYSQLVLVGVTCFQMGAVTPSPCLWTIHK